MTNSADPDQLAFEGANWSGSALFAKAEYILDGPDQQDQGKKREICISKNLNWSSFQFKWK